MGNMGFLASSHAGGTGLTTKVPENCLLHFDSGNGISFEDARYHLLVMGTTGSGKTASVVLPSLLKLIKGGHCGLIVDIKGNLRNQVRSIAQHCGREADIIELGSAPSATPLNLLYGLDSHAAYEFMENLTMQSFSGASHNKDFHIKGVSMAKDCALLLQYLNKIDSAFEPNLATIAEMFNNYELAAKLFTFFKKSVCDQSDQKQQMFIKTVEANNFHLLTFEEKKKDRNSSYFEQLTYATQSIRIALGNFLEVPGLARNFASDKAEGLDMRRLLSINKIILLRFGPDTGPIGAMLARFVMQEYYKAVYAIGLTMPKGKYSFVCLDEFQELVDIGPGRFSDANFIAQAREFNAIFIASTQSMSALANKGNSFSAVDAFVSNCNGRVLFYSDDPLTQQMASRYDDRLQLNALSPGQAFVVQYDHESRRHASGLEACQNSFEQVQAILRNTPLETVEIHPGASEATPGRPSLYDLSNQLIKYELDRKNEEATAIDPIDSKSKTTRARLFLPSDMRDDAESKVIGDDETKTIILQEDEMTPAEEGEERLIQKYPQFLSSTKDGPLSIPLGWLDYVDWALKAFSESGLDLEIFAFSVDDGALRVYSESRSLAKELMNRLLRGTQYICTLCGCSMRFRKKAQVSRNGINWLDAPLPVCNNCLEKYGLKQRRKSPKREAKIANTKGLCHDN